ncbi:chemotaxis protein CheA [Thioclava sp. GXIMD4216]|uniref:chemotaxis protein CheA n=1 Tax=Thioclava sp. GXIMD4216 TaxID=3131929 RepID=UPI0030CE4280
MSDPMAEIRASFFVECEELLESLQDALIEMDEGAYDNETINVVFRAVHSIKGGAGAFGLDALVAFAHRYETVMDEVRSGKLQLSPDAVKHFFQCADFLSDHVRAAQAGDPPPQGAEEALCELESLMGMAPGGAVEEEEVSSDDFQPMGLSFDLDLGAVDEVSETRIEVDFVPKAELFTSGNEPLHLFRALHELCPEMVATLDLDAIPELDDLNPEIPYLSWNVVLTGDVNEMDIREVFDFVEDVSTLEIKQDNGVENSFLPFANDGAEASTDAVMDAEFMDAPSSPAPQPEPTAVMPAPVEATPAPERAAPKETEAGAAAAQAKHGNDPSPTVRVDLDRIDRLVNLVGELVINQAMLAQSVAEAGLPPNSAVMTGLEAFMMLTRDIQDSVMMIRAQPVKPLFQRMGRIVREASAAVGKDVRLKVEGETTEVDKTVIERLADPLTHMIRNSVDHGLETPDKRRAAGKPEEGVITLSAQHRSGRVVIEIEDDGAGINRPKVLAKAIEKGLVAPEAQLTDAEIDNLLFLPGFSTADQVSALSGRGVGMDVVRSSIQSLGGRITIHSEPGKGTIFSISLPLTLAVLDGMVVNVAGETLVVPLNAILETQTLTAEDLRKLGPTTNVIHVRGEFVPLYDLGAELGYRGAKSNYEGCIVLLTAQEDGRRNALIVDQIMEQRQVVIKGLQQAYGHIPGIAAATILGDGQIALILDPADLVQNATGHTRSDFALAG